MTLQSGKEWSLPVSHAYVWTAYLACGVLAVVVAVLLETSSFAKLIPGEESVLTAAVGDLVATVLIWLSAILVKNSSMYDPYWSVIPPVLAGYWYSYSIRDQRDVPVERVALVFVSICVWAVRLTYNWSIGWTGMVHEDWRYVMIHQKFRDWGLPDPVYWLVGSFGGIMLFPTVLVFAGCVPMYTALTWGRTTQGANPFNALDVVATALAVGAATLQLVSDGQMRRWREDKSSGIHTEEYMQRGLWRFSRHPNYLGEVLLWWAMYLHALAASWNLWYTVVGAILMTLLFVFASIPMMEKRSLARRPAYKEVINSTSMLLLWFPKRSKASKDLGDATGSNSSRASEE